MDIFYHGTCRLFDAFDPARLGSGEGKSKFGHGIYITSSYSSAARYASKAGKNNGIDDYYVYTLEVPELTEGAYLISALPVNPDIVTRIETALGEEVPAEAKTAGKYFRKYVGNLLVGNKKTPENKKGMTIKKMIKEAESDAENAASRFFNEHGITYLVWPYSQLKPEKLQQKIQEVGLEGIETNRAILNPECIRILKIEKVRTTPDNDFIPGSEELIFTR